LFRLMSRGRAMLEAVQIKHEQAEMMTMTLRTG
jgi:hypothetical protein